MSVRHDLEEKNTSMVQILEINKNELKQYQKKVDNLSKQPEELQAIKTKLEDQITSLSNKLTEEQTKVKEKDEKINKLKHESMKEKAIMQQEMKFTKQESEDLQRQCSDLKNRLDSLSALEGLPSRKTDYSAELDAERQKFEHQIEELKEKQEQDRKLFNSQIERLKEKAEDLERENARIEEESTEKIINYKNLYDNLKQEHDKIKANLHSLESQRLKESEQISESYILKIESLESDIENLKLSHSAEMASNQKKAGDNMKALRQLYEEEKKKLNDRLLEEKQKILRMTSSNQDDLDDRLKQQEELYESQIEGLQQKIDELEIESKAYHHSYQQ